MEFNSIYYSFKNGIKETKEEIHSLIRRVQMYYTGSRKIRDDLYTRNYISFIIDSNDYLHEINDFIIAGKNEDGSKMLLDYMDSLKEYPFQEMPDHQFYKAYQLLETLILEKNEAINERILDYILLNYEYFDDRFGIDLTDLFFEHYQDIVYDYTKNKLRARKHLCKVNNYSHYE